MIKIHTYENHPNGKFIFDRYLYLAALVLPFSPHDVLGKDQLKIDGKVVTADNFLEISSKKPRARRENYKNLMEKYELRDYSKDRTEQFKEDELLAAKVIYNDDRMLYDYLYVDSSIENPVLNREKLRKLMTVKMDELDDELNKLKENVISKKNELLNVVFRYHAFSGNPEAIKLLKAMDIFVCPYCNRQYTFTVSDKNGTSRAQFDHYLPKDKYPFFAVSLFNLVPCCGLCNLAKGDKEDFLYPYSEEMGNDVRFETKYLSDFRYLVGNKNAINGFDIKLNIVGNDLKDVYKKKVKKSIECLHLETLYNEHRDYILDLFQTNYIYSDAYVDILCRQFPDIFPSQNEVKKMMYLMNIDKEHWGERTIIRKRLV